jgi:hypothetical protein
LLESTSTCSDCFFDFSEVKYAVSRLKAHKNDGCSNLTSDHFINAGNGCLEHIALLFSAMAFHGTAPDNLLCSTIIPIPKGTKGNVTDSNNFRGIMLSSIFVKLFDNIVCYFVMAIVYHRQSCSLVSKPKFQRTGVQWC